MSKLRDWMVRIRQAKSPLQGRQPLAIERIRTEYYANIALSESEFEQLWSEIAGSFRIDPSLMRPDDRFGIELRAQTSLAGSDEDVILGGVLARFEQLFGLSSEIDAHTVDDIIRGFAERRTR